MSSEGQGNKWASVNRKIDSAKLEGVTSSQTLELNSFFWLCRSGLWLISTWNPCLAQVCHKTSPHLTTAEWRKCCHISSVLFSYSVLENERCMWLFLRFETWKWAQHEVRWTSEMEKKEGRRSMAESQGLGETSLSQGQVIMLIEAILHNYLRSELCLNYEEKLIAIA